MDLEPTRQLDRGTSESVAAGWPVLSAAPTREGRGTFARVLDTSSGFLILGWLVVTALLIADVIWASASGLSFTNLTGPVYSVGLLLAIGISYSDRYDSRLTELCNFAALWVAFSAVGSAFTYVAATMRMPLCDTALAQADAALGYHWAGVFHFVIVHPVLRIPLAFAYWTMLPQMLASILFFAHTGQTERNREFLAIAMVSLVITTLISGIAPAVGPYIVGHQPDFALTLLAIRSGAASVFSLNTMQGIVTMPSYHTVIAILLIYVHRPPSRSFSIFAPLSALMLLSVSPIGNHYLSDVIAGAGVLALSIIIVNAGLKPRFLIQSNPDCSQNAAAG